MIVTLLELKQYLQEPVDTSDRDSLYTQLINGAESVIEKEIGKFQYQIITGEKHIASKYVIPKVLPIISVSKVYLDGNELDNEYWVNYNYSIVIINYENKYKEVIIDYSGGYEIIPSDIKLVALLLVSNWLNLNRQIPPDTSIDYRMSGEVKRLLIPYKTRRYQLC